MPTTPMQALPYPALTDVPNGPAGFQNLATAVEPKLVMVFATSAARTAAVTAPTAGMVTYQQDTKRYETYDGTAWRPWVATALPANTTANRSATLPSAAQGQLFYNTSTARVEYFDNTNWNSLGGATLCTSSTRPTTSVYDGRLIYETDTFRFYVWQASATAWVYLATGGTLPVKSANVVANATATTTNTSISGSTPNINTTGGKTFKFTVNIPRISHSAASATFSWGLYGTASGIVYQYDTTTSATAGTPMNVGTIVVIKTLSPGSASESFDVRAMFGTAGTQTYYAAAASPIYVAVEPWG